MSEMYWITVYGKVMPGKEKELKASIRKSKNDPEEDEDFKAFLGDLIIKKSGDGYAIHTSPVRDWFPEDYTSSLLLHIREFIAWGIITSEDDEAHGTEATGIRNGQSFDLTARWVDPSTGESFGPVEFDN